MNITHCVCQGLRVSKQHSEDTLLADFLKKFGGFLPSTTGAIPGITLKKIPEYSAFNTYVLKKRKLPSTKIHHFHM